jgi:hypothetical protein
MHSRLFDRLVIAMIVVSMIVPPLPAAAQQRQGRRVEAPRVPSGPDALPAMLAQGKFDNARADRKGNYQSELDAPGATAMTFFYSPAAGEFSQWIDVPVAEDADQLHLALTTAAAARGDVRLRLVDPSGAQYAPGRLAGNRYDRMRDLGAEFERAVGARRQPDMRAVARDTTGFFYRAPTTSDAIVHIKDPMPGQWRIKVTSRGAGAGFFLAAATIELEQIRELFDEGQNICCDDQGRSSWCTSLVEIMLSVLPLIAAGLATAPLAGAAATTVVAAVIIESIVLGTGNILVELEWVNAKAWKGLKLAYKGALTSVKLTAVTGSPAAIFVGIVQTVRSAIGAIAAVLCALFVDGALLVMPTWPAAAVVDRKYKADIRVLALRGFKVQLITQKKEQFPPGLTYTLNPRTDIIEISGEPTEVGTYKFRFKATDNKSKKTTSERAFTIVVLEEKAKPADLIVEFLAPEKPEARPGQPLNFVFGVANLGDTVSQSGFALVTWSTKRDSKAPGFVAYQDHKALAAGASSGRYKVKLQVPKFLPANSQIFVTVKVDDTKATDEGPGEKNNTATVQVPVIGVPTYKVTVPRSDADVKQGSKVDIRWSDGAEQGLRNATIKLFQSGRQVGTAIATGTFVAPGFKWTVPKNVAGSAFRIVVESRVDEVWAQSDKFNIIPATVDLTGKWDMTLTLNIDGETGKSKYKVDITHNVNKGTVTMDWNSKDFGIWTLRTKKGNTLEITKAPFPDLCPDLLKCAKVKKNSGTYTDAKFHVDLDGLYTDDFFGDFSGQFDLDGTRR